MSASRMPTRSQDLRGKTHPVPDPPMSDPEDKEYDLVSNEPEPVLARAGKEPLSNTEELGVDKEDVHRRENQSISTSYLSMQVQVEIRMLQTKKDQMLKTISKCGSRFSRSRAGSGQCRPAKARCRSAARKSRSAARKFQLIPTMIPRAKAISTVCRGIKSSQREFLIKYPHSQHK